MRKSKIQNPKSKTHHRRSCRVELLEPLHMLSAISWIGPATGGNWSTAADWSSGAVPGGADDVTISGNVTVTLNSGTNLVNTLTVGVGATLAVTGGSALELEVGSGTAVTDNGAIDLGDAAGTNFGSLLFNPNQTLGVTSGDTGTVVLGNNGQNQLGQTPGLNQTMTIAQGITVDAGDGVIGGSPAGSLTNDGTIDANVSGGTVTVELGTGGVNNGLIESSGATLTVEGDGSLGRVAASASNGWTNSATGTISATGGTLNVDQGAFDPWANQGTISSSGATVNLGGVFTQAGMGNTFVSPATPPAAPAFIRNSGDTVNLTGALIGNLALDNTTGSWNLVGGEIGAPPLGSSTGGGTFSANEGATLFAAPSAGGTLDAETLDSPIDFSTNSGASATVTGGSLTLNNVTLDLGNATGTTFGILVFNGPSTLQAANGATGTIVMGANSANQLGPVPGLGQALTIGQGITIDAANGEVGGNATATLTNQGTIDADGAGTIIVNGATVTNSGTFEATSGGILTVNPVGGTLSNFSAGTLTGGTWLASGGGTLGLTGAAVATDAANITVDGATSNIVENQIGNPTVDALFGLSTIASGGSLSLLDGYKLSTSGALANNGSLTLGTSAAASVLTVGGNYTQAAGAALDAQIGGTPASGLFGQLAANGNTSGASLAGTLNATLANSFAPQAGELFPLITTGAASGRTGTFATVNVPQVGGQPAFTAQYNANNFTLASAITVTTVSNVSSVTADGPYTVGATIAVTVEFSSVVNVTGVPEIALNSGGTADYAFGSGTNTLTFAYKVAAGQNVNRLDATGANALTLNGGTIDDTAGNPANLTLPAPGAAGSLGANKSIEIDTVSPTLTGISSTTPNGAYTIGDTVEITIAFSKVVLVSSTPQIALNSGGSAVYAGGSGTNTLTFTYTVAAGQNANPLDEAGVNAIALNNGTIGDAAGNNAILTLPAPGTAGSLGANKTIVIDTTAPAVSNVSSTTANGTYSVGATIDVTIAFSEVVDVTGTPELALNSGGTADFASGSGTNTLTFTYTVAAGQNANPLDETGANALTLDGGTIADVAGNAATLTLPAPGAAGSLGANKTIVIDTTAPTVSNVSSTTANGTYSVGATIDVTIAFSEVVNVTGTPELALNSGGIAVYASGGGTNTLTFTYTVAAGQSANPLDETSASALLLDGGTIADVAGNAATLTLPAPGAAGSLGANNSIIISSPVVTPPTLVVTNLSDTGVSGDGSLRGEIAAVPAGGAIITFAPRLSGTIDVTAGQPPLLINQGPLTIEGPGANVLSVSEVIGANSLKLGGTLFQIGPGVIATISGLTISDAAPGIRPAILDQGTLTLNAVAVVQSAAVGVDVLNTGSATIDNSTIAENEIGVFNQGAATITNSTIADNSQGGLSGGSFTVVDSTISGNQSPNPGAGINGSAQLTGTIVAGNTAQGQPSDIFGAVSGNNDLIGDGAGMTGIFNGQSGNIVGASGAPVDARLFPFLVNAGGTTLTIPPLPGSPAIGAGVAVAGVTTDERGFARPASSPPDMGAVQTGAAAGITVTATAISTTLQSVFDGVVATFSDANSHFLPSDYTAAINWGDGTSTSQGTVVAGPGNSFSVLGTHIYQQAGPYFPVEVAIVDRDGDPAAVTVSPAAVATAVTRIGDTLYVNNASDTGLAGDGSLRGEIAQANQDFVQGVSDTIVFNPNLAGATIQLAPSQGSLTLSGNMTINGLGANKLTVEGSGAASGTSVFVSKAIDSISGLTISGGDSTTQPGGGIDLQSGALTLSAVVITGNSTSFTGGGGIYAAGSLTMTDSTVYDNAAVSGAPGALLSGGAIDVVDGNPATNDPPALQVLIENSTITGNTVDGFGGAMDIYSPGGESPQITLYYDTITSNQAVTKLISHLNNGAGINVNVGAVNVQNTILLDNFDITPSGGSLGEDDSEGFEPTNGNNLFNLEAPLAAVGVSPLAENGGPTPTEALLPGSSAIGGGIQIAGITTDQRGEARPTGSQPDIGAYQSPPFSNGQIKGTVYLEFDPGLSNAEPISGVTVFVDLHGDGTLDPGDPTTVTDGNGDYQFTGLESGQYFVQVLAGPNRSLGDIKTNGRESLIGGIAGTRLPAFVTAGSPPVTVDFYNFANSPLTIAGGAPFPAGPIPPSLFPGINTTDPNVKFVNDLYRQLLFRDADASGLSQYVSEAAQGVNVAREIWMSPEHLGLEVDQYYQAFLNRDSDPAGRAYWVAQLSADYAKGLTNPGPEERVIAAILSTPEYAADHPSNYDFVAALYNDVLGRDGSTADIDSWLSELTAGSVTRQAMIQDFIGSTEALDHAVDSFFAAYLQRPADPDSLSYFAAELQQQFAGPSPAQQSKGLVDVGTSILESPEFFSDAQQND